MSTTMAKTPEDILKETDHLFKESSDPKMSNPECTYLQAEYERLSNEYENPDLPAKLRLAIATQLRAIARSLQTLHCGVPVLQ